MERIQFRTRKSIERCPSFIVTQRKIQSNRAYSSAQPFSQYRVAVRGRFKRQQASWTKNAQRRLTPEASVGTDIDDRIRVPKKFRWKKIEVNLRQKLPFVR